MHHVQQLIDGQFVDSNTSEWIDITDPATQEVIAKSRKPLTLKSIKPSLLLRKPLRHGAKHQSLLVRVSF